MYKIRPYSSSVSVDKIEKSLKKYANNMFESENSLEDVSEKSENDLELKDTMNKTSEEFSGNKMNILKKLSKLANRLDIDGHYDIADKFDMVIKKNSF